MWPMSYHICSEIPHWKHWSLMAEQPLAVPWKTPTWRVCCLLQSCQRHLFIGALQSVSKWVWSEYKKQVSFVNLRQLTYNGPLRASWGSFIGPTTKSNWTSVDWHTVWSDVHVVSVPLSHSITVHVACNCIWGRNGRRVQRSGTRPPEDAVCSFSWVVDLYAVRMTICNDTISSQKHHGHGYLADPLFILFLIISKPFNTTDMSWISMNLPASFLGSLPVLP